MPTLFVILGNRIGLKMTLAMAPMHSLVKYTDSEGQQWNLEPTSGGGFSRDSHYRKMMPSITDAALANGVYLKGLTRDETIAFLGGAIVQKLTDDGRLEDASAVAKRLFDHAPNSVYSKLIWANIFALLLKRDVIAHYKSMDDIPPDVRAYADEIYRLNTTAFAEAEALGWRDPVVIPDKRMGPLQ